MAQQEQEQATVVTAKCVGCGATKEIREGEYGSGELPMCDKCYSPMFAHEARTESAGA
jgi:hypothetical protein